MTTGLTDLPLLIADRRRSFFGHIDTICFTSITSIHWCLRHWYLLPLTGNVRQTVHGELGVNRWKKIWVYPSVPVNSQPWTARCGDRYDPQRVKRSS